MRSLVLTIPILAAACVAPAAEIVPAQSTAARPGCDAATFPNDPRIGAAFTDRFNGRYWNNREQMVVWREDQRLFIGEPAGSRVQLQRASPMRGSGAFRDGCGAVYDFFLPPDGPGGYVVVTEPHGPRSEWHRREPRAAAMAFQHEASALHERVRSDPYFGGFILRHRPEPHAVVMFTRDAEARLRHYTRDPRYRAQLVDLTLAQLEAMKDDVARQLGRLGLRCFTVDGDEEHNAVTITTVELERLERAVAQGLVRLPPKVRIRPGRCAELR